MLGVEAFDFVQLDVLSDNFAMCRFPEADRSRVAAEHNGVVPAPDPPDNVCPVGL
ncbi:MAG TPA: hypothetical protein VF060_22270 [Trebonia sp.]